MCDTPQTPTYDVDLTTVTIYIQTIVPSSGKADNTNKDTINDVFFLGYYNNDAKKELHLFCREVDAAIGTALDVDLGCVEGVLSNTTLYVWSNDPKTSNYALKMQTNPSATSHYPIRYVTNVSPAGPANTANKRAQVVGYGSGSSGVRINDQS